MTAILDTLYRHQPPAWVVRSLYRLLIGMVAIAALAVIAMPFFSIGINLDHSLPGHVFLIHKDGTPPGRGQIVAFRFQGYEPYFPEGTTFVKILAGVPGDTVSAMHNGCIEYRVNVTRTDPNGTLIGCAKPKARDGRELRPGPTGMIPDGEYAVRGTHADSMDSRYAAVGWVGRSQIIGRAWRIF